MEKTYSQREFASLIGVSTATVSSMIKSGEIRRAPDGRIPQMEIQHYYENIIRRHSNQGTLILTFHESDEGVNNIMDNFEDSFDNKVPRYFPSIHHVITEASKSENLGESEVQVDLIQEKYNKMVLNTFIQQYQSKASEYLVSLISEKKYPDFCKLPCEIAYDLILYGKVIVEGYFDSAIEDYLSSVENCIDDIQFAMKARFELLMKELMLTGKDDKLLFEREQLTPEFFEKKGALYNSFFYNNGEKDIVYIKRNEKISKSVSDKSKGRKIKDNIENLLSDPFYTVLNIDNSDKSVSEAASMIGSGYYHNLLVTANKNAFKEYSLLWMTADIACKNNRINVAFIE